MRIALLTSDAWPRLSALARDVRRRPAFVAVPYIGSGAVRRLPLRKGDLLVTRFDDAALRAGLVDPREVLAYLRRGVAVHAVANLHAKVFVLGSKAVVGSTNISTQSADYLIEAACETDSVRVVAAARRFVLSLTGDAITPEFARMKAPLYAPSKFVRPRAGRTPAQSPLLAFALEPVDYDERDTRAKRTASSEARARLQDPSLYRVDDFRWTGTLPPGLEEGCRILMCTRRSARRMSIAEPARVLKIRAYRGPRGPRAVVMVEIRKGSRQRLLSSIVRVIPAASSLKRLRGCRRVRDLELVRSLGALWAGARLLN